MTEQGLKPIEDKFLSIGDLFAMKFNQGLVFMEVQGWEQNRYSPHSGIEEISADGSSGWTRLEDDGDDILYVEKQNNKVLHVGIGQSPSELRRYTNYPEGEVRLRSIPNLSSPRPGDTYGYVDGEDSPFATPTDAEELFISPGTHVDFNFHNPTDEPKEPLLNIKLREYKIRPLNHENADDRNAIKRVVSTGSPMPIVPAGSTDRQQDFDLQEKWNVEPISYERARNLGGGR